MIAVISSGWINSPRSLLTVHPRIRGLSRSFSICAARRSRYTFCTAGSKISG
jgi:hypothetical protein